MLTALEQHFLVHHVYVPSSAHFLNGERPTLQGGWGPDRAYWMTDAKGINYTMPGEEIPEPVLTAKGGWVKEHRGAHRLTWAAIREHVAHQPKSLTVELATALADSTTEARRYHDAMTAISKSWYSDATDEQRAALDAEQRQSYAVDDIIRARIRAVVLALLPLHDAWPDDEPADLIEWAVALL